MRGRSKKKSYCLLVGFSSLVVVYIAATVTIGWYGLQNAEEEFMDRLFFGESSGSGSSGSDSGTRTAKKSPHPGSALQQSQKAPAHSDSLLQANEHPPIAELIAQQEKVQQILRRTQQRSFLPLQAITEDSSHLLANSNNGYQYPKPLPLRTQPRLQTFTYFQSVQSCRDLPNGWPVDHDLHQDSIYSPMVGDDMKSLYGQRQEYAPICPVDLDPFLPWIHDVIPNVHGTHITILAHNKRRCRQDPKHFRDDQDNLEPQVALLQSVSVRRLVQEELQNLHDPHIPREWKSPTTTGSRYQLAPIDQADEDAKETRFICQFHMLGPTKDGKHVEKIVVGETFSQFPYNYEHANLMHRKGQKPNPMLTRASSPTDVNGLHNEQIWNAILEFSCPVPSHLQDLVRQSQDIIIPMIYMDIVPIRTPPREDRVGYNPWHWKRTNFSPLEEWGAHPILPPLEQSGRWQNVPICPASSANQNHPSSNQAVTTVANAAPPPPQQESSNQKENYLVGCLWASAAFSTRGENRLDTSTQDRLLEWLTYHLDVAGFDKMIIYDNTEAFTNETSLQPVVGLVRYGSDCTNSMETSSLQQQPTDASQPGRTLQSICRGSKLSHSIRSHHGMDDFL